MFFLKYVILNFPALDFLVYKIKEMVISKIFISLFSLYLL